MKRVSAKTIIRITAKIIGIVAVILGLTLILTIFLQSMVTNFFSGLNADQEEENYVVKRLSAESNARGVIKYKRLLNQNKYKTATA